MRSDEESPAESTCRIFKGLDAVWAYLCLAKPCLLLSTDGTISYKTLSTTLKELEADGLVHREEYPRIPPKVEYSLTMRGKFLIPILDSMCEWGERNRAE